MKVQVELFGFELIFRSRGSVTATVVEKKEEFKPPKPTGEEIKHVKTVLESSVQPEKVDRVSNAVGYL